jgi:hypothetical protein
MPSCCRRDGRSECVSFHFTPARGFVTHSLSVMSSRRLLRIREPRPANLPAAPRLSIVIFDFNEKKWTGGDLSRSSQNVKAHRPNVAPCHLVFDPSRIRRSSPDLSYACHGKVLRCGKPRCDFPNLFFRHSTNSSTGTPTALANHRSIDSRRPAPLPLWFLLGSYLDHTTCGDQFLDPFFKRLPCRLDFLFLQLRALSGAKFRWTQGDRCHDRKRDRVLV